MMKRALVVVAMVAALVGCGRGTQTRDGTAGQQGAERADDVSKSIARVDPCSLLTKDEIQQQLEQTLSPDQLAGLERKGAVWTISMESVPRGVSRACQVHWQAAVNGDTQMQDDFAVVVTSAAWLTGSVAAMETPLPIPNLGDEAYFVGGKSGPPYARVGDVAIGIEGFRDSKQSRSGVDVLRLVVSRARAAR